MLLDLIDQQTNPTIATYAKTKEVHLRVTARAESEDAAKQLLKPVIKEIKKRFGNAVYTTDEHENLEDVVVRLLKEIRPDCDNRRVLHRRSDRRTHRQRAGGFRGL